MGGDNDPVFRSCSFVGDEGQSEKERHAQDQLEQLCSRWQRSGTLENQANVFSLKRMLKHETRGSLRGKGCSESSPLRKPEVEKHDESSIESQWSTRLGDAHLVKRRSARSTGSNGYALARRSIGLPGGFCTRKGGVSGGRCTRTVHGTVHGPWS